MPTSTRVAPILPSFTVLIILALTACSDNSTNSGNSEPVSASANSQTGSDGITGADAGGNDGVNSETENTTGGSNVDAGTDNDVNGNDSQNTVENTTGEGGSSGGTPLQTSGATVSDRLKTMSIDLDRDGTINEVWAYSYDSDGRIVSREVSDIDDPTNNRTITFNYEGNNLVSKVSSSGPQDTHIYDAAGRVISSQRHWDGTQEYGYDSSGRLISTVGSDFITICGDDDMVAANIDDTTMSFENPTMSFSLTYQGDLLSGITSSDGLYKMEVGYTDRGRIRTLVKDCSYGIEFNTVINYNDDGQITSIEDFEITSFEDFEIETESSFVSDRSTTTFNYNDQGRIESFIETDYSGTTTTTITLTPEGYPLTQDLVNTDQNSTIFLFRDYSIMFEYEDASCQIAFTVDPTVIPFLDVVLQGRDFNTPLDCIYQLDQGDF